jgi:hypothetical protein
MTMNARLMTTVCCSIKFDNLSVDQKYLESLELWCWRMMEISWTGHMRNEDVLHGVKEESSAVRGIKRKRTDWIGHNLHTNCLLKRVIKGKIKGSIKVTERRGRRRKQLLDDLKENKGCWKLKEEALDRILWSARFGRGYGSAVRQIAEWMNEPLRRYSACPNSDKIRER